MTELISLLNECDFKETYKSNIIYKIPLDWIVSYLSYLNELPNVPILVTHNIY